MKVNLNKSFLDLYGNPIFNTVNNQIESIKDTICLNLFTANPTDVKEKYECFMLSIKLNSVTSEIDLTPDEISLILKYSTKLNAGGYGQIYNILNGNPQI